MSRSTRQVLHFGRAYSEHEMSTTDIPGYTPGTLPPPYNTPSIQYQHVALRGSDTSTSKTSLHGSTAATSPSEKTRLIPAQRGSVVSYLPSGAHLHRLLPNAGSNVVFPSTTSSVSLSRIQYNPDSSVECIPYGSDSSSGLWGTVPGNDLWRQGFAHGGRAYEVGTSAIGGGIKYRRKLFQRRGTSEKPTSLEKSLSHKEEEEDEEVMSHQGLNNNNGVINGKGSLTISNETHSSSDHISISSSNPRGKDKSPQSPTILPITAYPCPDGSARLRINVSGQYYEARLGILDRHPETLLGDRRKRSQFFDRGKNELFFDRHRPSFEAIFVYYQFGGRLRRPHHVPDDVFLEEILFYQLEKDTVEEYKRSQGYTFQSNPLPSSSTLRKIWMLFEYPETSLAAFIVAITSVLMTLVSIVLFCVETLPKFATSHCVAGAAPNFLDPFFLIETVCTAWFTIEAIARFIACPNKLGFWKDFKNIVDVLAIIPYYVTLFNVLSSMSCEGAKSSASLAFLRVIRLVRIFKLTKHSVGLQVLLMTFQASLEGLGLFLVALCVCLLLFSSTIYYAELGVKGSQIQSIPDAFWWAIITMTTVGYGDKVPVGNWGKLVGAMCAITGVLTLAIPVPIITGHFNRFYAHKTGRGRHI